jgi:hypothetical protein
MSEEIRAVLGKESIEGGGEVCQKSVESAPGCGAQIGFEFGEGQFDGIEIGTVWWKVNQGGSAALDGGCDRGAFVGGEIVGDDDIAWRQSRTQALLDISGESGPIHGAIE